MWGELYEGKAVGKALSGGSLMWGKLWGSSNGESFNVGEA